MCDTLLQIGNRGPHDDDRERPGLPPQTLEKDVRKRLQVEHAPHLPVGAKVIKLGDKTANVGDVVDALIAEGREKLAARLP